MLPTMTELAAAMVARQEMPPEKGELGPIGPNGKAGLDGEDGRNGDPGRQGDRGDRGQDGVAGADGRNGADGKDGADGEPGLIWRGPWVRNLQYWADDAVEQDGSSYVCTLATRSKPPSGAWDLLAKRGDTGPPGMSRGGGGGSGGGSSSLTVKDEGVTLDAAAASIDFVGDGVTATAAGHSLTVTIPGGGGTQTLAQVLVAGNDPGGTAIIAAEIGGSSGASLDIRPAFDASLGGRAELAGGTGADEGGEVVLVSGRSDAGDFSGASLTLTGATDSSTGFIVGAGGGFNFNVPAQGGVQLFGETGLPGVAGTEGIIGGGAGNGGATEGAYIRLEAGDGAATHGRVQLKTNATDGNAADVLTAQGDGTALWGTVIAALIAGGAQAAFVEPTTATPESIALSLIAAGLMAAA